MYCRCHNIAVGVVTCLLLAVTGPVAAAPADSAATTADDAGIEEVIVSARKRDEALQDVPVAVSALGSAALERLGSRKTSDLIATVPSLFLTTNNISAPTPELTNLVIRGVGATPAIEPSVGFFIDGVYTPNVGFDTSFLDVERVEVLRGPQGTLFGRNTQGGAVNIVTSKPGDVAEGKASIIVDEHDTLNVRASQVVPLGQAASASISLFRDETNGYIRNVTLHRDQDALRNYGGRLALRLQPGDRLAIDLTADGAFADGGLFGSGILRVRDGERFPESYQVLDDYYHPYQRDLYGFAATVNYDFDSMVLTSLTGYRNNKTDVAADWDGGSDLIDNRQRQRTSQSLLSQELRLASDGKGALDWMVGLYGFAEDYRHHRDFDLINLGSATPTGLTGIELREDVEQERQGFAVFGQADYDLTDRLNLTLGGRYSYEEAETGAKVFYDIPEFDATVDFDRLNQGRARDDFDAFTGSASLAYKFAPGVLGYVTLSQGFKTGGYQKYPADEGTFGIPIGPEHTLNYELGLKSEFFDRRMLLNLAAFQVEISDQQLSTIAVVNGVPVEAVVNAGEARTRGLELETTLRPNHLLWLSGSLSYTDAKFTSYIDPTGASRAGDRLPWVPRWLASISAEQRLPLGNGDLVGFIKWSYVDEYTVGLTDALFDQVLQIPRRDRLDVRVGYETGPLAIELFANNVFDSYDIGNAYTAFLFTAEQRLLEQPLPPRTVGARVTYRW